jgi:amino acid permease
LKDNEQYEIYEKARKRTKQKKRLYFHSILFLIGSVFFVILNKIIKYRPELDWFVWAIFIWLFFLIIHFINVFVMNKFFGKEWVRIQSEKLIEKHQMKLEKLEKKLDKKGDFTPDNSEEDLNS